MSSSSETVDKFQGTLNAYIKPREQVNYIRRVLALHLGSSTSDEPLKQPASLNHALHDVTVSREARGTQQEYLAALKANVEARQKYEEIVHANAHRQDVEPKSPSPKTNVLEERIALVKLQTKQQKLSIMREYLDTLAQKAAASPNFLDAEEVFQGTTSLPSIPQEIVNSLVVEQSIPRLDLKDQLSQLEKTVLGSKLLLRREEQLLKEAKSKSGNFPDVLSHGTRLEALRATRTELIDWIETELGKASGSDHVGEDHEPNEYRRDKSNQEKASVDQELAEIKGKYAEYVAARRSLLENMTQRSGASRPPKFKPLETEISATEAVPAPSSYLLTPYIESLLSISRKQKSMISQKTHMNTALGKQIKDASQVLSHLAEESQLLPRYPLKGSTRRRSGLGDEMMLTTSERDGLSGNVQPWVFAADSCKIATLETVAEKVEGGQVALENTVKTLHDIDHMLGLDRQAPNETRVAEDQAEDQTEDDVWLTSTKVQPSTMKHTEQKAKEAKVPQDLWSNLHSNLGLLRNDDTV